MTCTKHSFGRRQRPRNDRAGKNGPTPSRFWGAATPVAAVFLTMIAGGIMFAALGKDPVEAIRIIFWDPLFNAQFASYSRPQLLIKAGPLILIAIGLSLGFKAGIWNIGAEGQYIIGAICGAAFGLAFWPSESPLLFPGMVIAGLIGGWAWAMIPRHPQDALPHE